MTSVLKLEGESLHVLKDNATNEILGYSIWFCCPVCGNDNLARIYDFKLPPYLGHGRCCKNLYQVNLVSAKVK